MRPVPTGKSDRQYRAVWPALELTTTQEGKVDQVRRGTRISTAATPRFRATRETAGRYTRVNPVPAAQPRNPTLVLRGEIQERVISWPECLVFAHSPGTRQRK